MGNNSIEIGSSEALCQNSSERRSNNLHQFELLDLLEFLFFRKYESHHLLLLTIRTIYTCDISIGTGRHPPLMAVNGQLDGVSTGFWGKPTFAMVDLTFLLTSVQKRLLKTY